MRISDWSSDVCSSDLPTSPWRVGCGNRCRVRGSRFSGDGLHREGSIAAEAAPTLPLSAAPPNGRCTPAADRKSVVSGKSVSVRVDLGGGRIIKKKKKDVHTVSIKQHKTQNKKN